MADISDELNTIKNERNGEPVLTAISSAMTAINSDADIASELYTITNGRYGSDIRMAIHDALYKLSESGGGGEESFMGAVCAYGNSAYCDEHVVGQPQRYDNTTIITIHCSDIRGGTKAYVQFAELHFYDVSGNIIDLTSYVTSITSNLTPTGSVESIDKSIDGSADTKYCASWNASSGLTVILEMDYSGSFGYFSYTTASDEPSRDMVSFTIDISKNTTSTRALDIENAQITSSRKTETQLFQLSI